jgi:hypothetical protein
MKKIYLIGFFTCVLAYTSFSQSFYNARKERSLILVGGMGLSTYFGELKTGNSFDTKPTLNVGLQYHLSQHISARVDATWFQLKGNDADAVGDPDRINRNLSFSSDNFEISGTLAFNLVPKGLRYYRRPGFNLYAFTGIGLVYFNPTAKLSNGETVSLPTFKTEGVDYSTVAPVIPMGLGVRLKVNRDINIAIEGGYRKMFTDYLDDVSGPKYLNGILDPNTVMAPETRELAYRGNPAELLANPDLVRGNPKSNDSYFLLNVKLEYYLPKDFIFGSNSGHRQVQRYKKKKSYYRKVKTR